MVVVAVALGSVFGVVVARAIAGYDITPVPDGQGATVTIDDRKVAVWVSPDVGTSYCTATDTETGRDSFSRSLTTSMSLTDGGRTWARVGIVDGAPGSTHSLSCTTESGVLVGTADNPRVVRYLVLGGALGGTALLLVVGAFVLALVTAVRRRPTDS